MLKNKSTELIELKPNSFSKIEYIWLVPTVSTTTNLIGFGFKDEETLLAIKNNQSNQSVLIDFGEVEIKIDEDVFSKTHQEALKAFPNFEIIKSINK